MSLSFVAKAIQTTAEDGTFAEEAIESTDDGRSSNTGHHKPLFEQLRSNKEQEDAEQEDFQRSMMRATGALDEEDAAHLEAIEKHKNDRETKVRQQTQKELDAFRAARADRILVAHTQTGSANTESPSTVETKKTTAITKKTPSSFVPQIMGKKRRRIALPVANTDAKEKQQDVVDEHEEEPEKKTKLETKVLGGLLAGYGSSSDED
jgi:hypothetical protein